MLEDDPRDADAKASHKQHASGGSKRRLGFNMDASAGKDKGKAGGSGSDAEGAKQAGHGKSKRSGRTLSVDKAALVAVQPGVRGWLRGIWSGVRCGPDTCGGVCVGVGVAPHSAQCCARWLVGVLPTHFGRLHWLLRLVLKLFFGALRGGGLRAKRRFRIWAEDCFVFACGGALLC